jgi:hypothetical protein
LEKTWFSTRQKAEARCLANHFPAGLTSAPSVSRQSTPSGSTRSTARIEW